MKVYVLTHNYDTPRTIGSEVIGVYKDIDDARFAMNSDAAEIRKEYAHVPLDDYLNWSKENQIHFGFYGNSYDVNASYDWEIETVELQ